MLVRAVSLDLDDTLWPVLPALIEAEHCVDRWLQQHHPDVASAWPIEAMRELREQIARDNTHLSHDFSEQRRLTIRHAFAACGIDDAPVDETWRIYFAARNNVELYPDSLAALERIVERVPLAPEFSYPTYLVYSRDNPSSTLQRAFELLREIAKEEGDWSQRWDPLF